MTQKKLQLVRLRAHARRSARSVSRAASGGRGAYLLLGSTFTMTSGPFAGQRFVKVGGATLVRLGPEGQRLPLRCVRAGAVRDDFTDAASAP